MFTTKDIPENGRARELAHRRSSDIDVRLMWDPGDDRVTVWVRDLGDGSAFVVDVGDRPAMDVFRHPYVYASLGEPACASIAA